MNPSQDRQHVTEIEVRATPDEVFRALTEAEQIVRWFAPIARVDPRVGGSFVLSWGGGMESTSTITIYEPGHRFATTSERTKPYSAKADAPAGPVQRLMVDYQIEAIGGGVTRLRLVHSGFGADASWDNDFEATRTGWAEFMQALKRILETPPATNQAG